MKTFCWIVFLVLSLASYAESAAPLPVWLTRMITVQRNANYPDVIEEVNYDGKRAFQVTHTDRIDAGSDHVLLNEEGEEICRFGGYEGQVNSGLCETQKIKYLHLIFKR